MGRQFVEGSWRALHCCSQPDRFRILSLLKQQVNNTGDSSWAWREARGEVVAYHYISLVTRASERICFATIPNKMRWHEVPIYDEYKGCSPGTTYSTASSTIGISPTPFRGTLLRTQRIYGIICAHEALGRQY